VHEYETYEHVHGEKSGVYLVASDNRYQLSPRRWRKEEEEEEEEGNAVVIDP
jgi:hypothetical protein